MIFLGVLDIPHVVTEAVPVSIPTEREVEGKTVYGKAEYTALAVRVATAEEVNQWRQQ